MAQVQRCVSLPQLGPASSSPARQSSMLAATNSRFHFASQQHDPAAMASTRSRWGAQPPLGVAEMRSSRMGFVTARHSSYGGVGMEAANLGDVQDMMGSQLLPQIRHAARDLLEAANELTRQSQFAGWGNTRMGNAPGFGGGIMSSSFYSAQRLPGRPELPSVAEAEGLDLRPRLPWQTSEPSLAEKSPQTSQPLMNHQHLNATASQQQDERRHQLVQQQREQQRVDSTYAQEQLQPQHSWQQQLPQQQYSHDQRHQTDLSQQVQQDMSQGRQLNREQRAHEQWQHPLQGSQQTDQPLQAMQRQSAQPSPQNQQRSMFPNIQEAEGLDLRPRLPWQTSEPSLAEKSPQTSQPVMNHQNLNAPAYQQPDERRHQLVQQQREQQRVDSTYAQEQLQPQHSWQQQLPQQQYSHDQRHQTDLSQQEQEQSRHMQHHQQVQQDMSQGRQLNREQQAHEQWQHPQHDPRQLHQQLQTSPQQGEHQVQQLQKQHVFQPSDEQCHAQQSMMPQGQDVQQRQHGQESPWQQQFAMPSAYPQSSEATPAASAEGSRQRAFSPAPSSPCPGVGPPSPRLIQKAVQSAVTSVSTPPRYERALEEPQKSSPNKDSPSKAPIIWEPTAAPQARMLRKTPAPAMSGNSSMRTSEARGPTLSSSSSLPALR
eukprot:TRINITY_DN913_c0_g1_i1.p1 TRINITY_DN913_c0_g1~~TRINITY_DN913_c0_g1_i1.p1  ORF type:complete len:751 (-),score=147.27 TRINITY_DN913_c0_g1_i1:99-2063(-)